MLRDSITTFQNLAVVTFKFQKKVVGSVELHKKSILSLLSLPLGAPFALRSSSFAQKCSQYERKAVTKWSSINNRHWYCHLYRCALPIVLFYHILSIEYTYLNGNKALCLTNYTRWQCMAINICTYQWIFVENDISVIAIKSERLRNYALRYNNTINIYNATKELTTKQHPHYSFAQG